MGSNQYGYFLSDDEFIAKWRENPSPAALSKVTGVNVRNIMARRRSIEVRYNIKLDTDPNYKLNRNKELAEKAKEEREKREEKLKVRLEATQHSVRRGMELEKGRVIIFSDAHFTNETTTAFKALLKFIEHFKPKAIICNGDAFDGAVLSRFPKINYERQPSVLDELNYCKIHLEAIEKVRPAGCRLIWPMGNHDLRYESFLVSRASEFSGVDGFSLKYHFPNWETCWSFWINDDTVIKHRHKGGRYAGYNNVQASFCNIFTGHTHVLTCSPISTFDQKTYWGVQTGTLADINSETFGYVEDSAKDWRQGFILASWDRGQLLMPEMIMTYGENEVMFRGEILAV